MGNEDKNSFEFSGPPSRIIDEELLEWENSKHEMKKKVFIIVLFDFQFPALEVPST